MRIWTLASCLVISAWAAQAEAGHGLFKHRVIGAAPVVAASSAAPCAACEAAQAGGMTTSGTSSFGQPPAPIHPYSYYAAAPGQARGYYGYGEDQFPYYGRAYGHPYDPWTWPYMSGYYQNSLNRYYEPVLK